MRHKTILAARHSCFEVVREVSYQVSFEKLDHGAAYHDGAVFFDAWHVWVYFVQGNKATAKVEARSVFVPVLGAGHVG